MNKVIIHISDLHVTSTEAKDGKPNINSWLVTEDNLDSNNFINHFIEFIIEKYSPNEKYLIVTGDISNKAREDEFEYAEIYLNEIVNKLEIKKENILLLPGDHDSNRILNSFANLKDSMDRVNITKKSYEYHSEKFQFFGNFYKSFLEKSFNPETSIIQTIIIDEKIVLIGLNSNYYIDEYGGDGGFNIENLRKELSELPSEYLSYNKIAVFHHNLNSNYEDKNRGQWDLENRKAVIAIFESFGIKVIFNGNEHTRGSDKLTIPEIFVSDAGAFCSKMPQASFKCYEVINTPKVVKLLQRIYTIQNRSGISDINSGYWATQDPDEIRELKEFKLWEEPKEVITPDTALDYIFKIEEEIIPQPMVDKPVVLKYENKNISDKLYKIIKSKKLFHSGHFHWSDTSRAHNWIDVSKILEDKEDLLFVKKSIIDVVETCNLSDKFDFVLGLGTEGNIISTRVAIMSQKDYSYLPYSYRYEDHNEFEQKLNFINDGKYKSVLVITDVVNDGRTIRKLIKKREADFFKSVERIIVIALIYTGDSNNFNHNILNYDSIEHFDDKNDEIVNNIEFYSVLNLKVEKCPYTQDTWKDCLIYKDKLDCVNLFYNEIKEI